MHFIASGMTWALGIRMNGPVYDPAIFVVHEFVAVVAVGALAGQPFARLILVE
jgi:hypothetical protein